MEHDQVIVRKADPEELIELRHAVLRAGLPRETAFFPGDDDIMSVHLVAELRGRVVGCVTMHRNPWDGQDAWQLRGMAVAQELRGRGVGTKLLAAAERAVGQHSPTAVLWCNARVPAVEFYRNRGWRDVSAVFDVPTAGPHVKMLKRLVRDVR